MVTEEEKALIHECLDALRRGVDGFRTRRPQLEMIAVVGNTLADCRDEEDPPGDGRHIGVIEAGTGTGKSFGALVPALVMARSRGKRLVVSSSTVALQHQYAGKDVPTLQRLLPMSFTYAVAKGRKRYVCAAKLAVEAQEARQLELDVDDRDRPADDEPAQRRREAVVRLADRLDSEEWSGDRDELAEPIGDELWNGLTTDRQGCSGSRCPHFAACPFYAARRRVKEADLVIANHDLVLASLETDAGSVLPPAAETVFVFDEAHTLAKKVVEHLSARHGLKGGREWVAGVAEVTRDAVLGLHLDERLIGDTRTHCEAIDAALGDLQAAIEATRAFEDKRARRFRNDRLPDWAATMGTAIHEGGIGLAKTMAQLREQMLARAGAEPVLVTRLLSEVGFYAGRLDNLIETWDLLLAEDSEDASPVARWIERHDEGSHKGDHLVCAAPLSGSDRLRSLLWNRAGAAILMSATLTSCGSFDLTLRQCGLHRWPGVHLLQVESPFDYRQNARLVIAGMASEPNDVQAHTEEVVMRLPELVRTRGTLVLFASGRQMRQVFAQMPEALRTITLMQGTLPKPELLARHKAAVSCGERSMLFGLASLAEGVDLPGELCTHVIVAKLPFPVPDSPLEEARREWLERQGRSPFLELCVPETAIRLKQGLGRLLRTHEDYGTATILDRRLVSKRWGRLLMRGLPDFEVVVEPVENRRRAALTPQ